MYKQNPEKKIGAHLLKLEFSKFKVFKIPPDTEQDATENLENEKEDLGNESMTAEMTNSAKGLGDKGEEIYRKYNENRQEKHRKSEPQA